MTNLIKKLELLWGISIFYVKSPGAEPVSFGMLPEEENPLSGCRMLADMLLKQCLAQELPVVYKDPENVYFVCAKGEDGFYLSGPVCTEELDYAHLHRFYRNYQIETKENRHPLRTSLMRILNFTAMLSELAGGIEVEALELLKANGLVEEENEETEKADTILEMHRLEEDVYHHTYQEERHVMDCVREGMGEDALQRLTGTMFESVGVLSGKQMNHYRYLAVAIVTMCTREAIAGGVLPSRAYRLSDIMINKIDRCASEESLVEYIRKAIVEFSAMVAKTKEQKQISGYTEQCKDYIGKHYHQKIHLEEVAEAIGVSQGHLSRVFHEDTGISIQDYIQQFRVERAANLLKYSEASLLEISNYVCFHSQSHFGSVFKKYMNMTPGQYRNQYKQKEFCTTGHKQ